MNQIKIYTDGSCLKNPGGAGGYAAIINYNKERYKTVKGGEPSSTNNRMEMMAVIAGLRSLNDLEVAGSNIIIYTDSKYVRNGFTKGWLDKWQRNGWRTAKKEPVKNQELWKKLLNLHFQYSFKIKYIPGHVGIGLNEECDIIAKSEAVKQKYTKDKQ